MFATFDKTNFPIVKVVFDEGPNSDQEFEVKLNTEIDAVNYPVKDFGECTQLPLELEYDFNFLSPKLTTSLGFFTTLKSSLVAELTDLSVA